MSRRRTIVLVAGLSLALASPARAQGLARPSSPLGQTAHGRIQGTIRDDAGAAVTGATVIALGSTIASARSDAVGRFSVTLPPGEYVLRATRSGYISDYREAVRVLGSGVIDRQIRLVREGSAAARAAAALPTTVAPSVLDHSHDEAAWRLRHLPPTVLRDRGGWAGDAASADPGAERFSPIDWAITNSRHAAAAIAAIDFSGHVNYVAASSVSTARGLANARLEALPNRIADLAIGAPVGTAGAWAVRGVMNDGAWTSWAVHGEYRSRDDRAHAFAVGLSYMAQVPASGDLSPSSAFGAGRRAGGAYGFDRWRLRRGFDLEYGVRIDRYDYLDMQTLPSGRLGVRADVLGGLAVFASGTETALAPGADEFLPPTAGGPWLPPSRTFSKIGRRPFTAEHVQHVEGGVSYALGTSHRGPTLSVRRFRQTTEDQVAALFGLDRTDAGHYFVASPGGVDVDGWGVRVAGRLAPHVTGQVDYSTGVARWTPAGQARLLTHFAPSVVRPASEALHDLSASVEASFPGSATIVVLACRLNTAFSHASRQSAGPRPDGRFALQVYHALPYQPLRGGRLDLLFALRTLSRDDLGSGSFFDELLTVAPPLRVVGGMRVSF